MNLSPPLFDQGIHKPGKDTSKGINLILLKQSHTFTFRGKCKHAQNIFSLRNVSWQLWEVPYQPVLPTNNIQHLRWEK